MFVLAIEVDPFNENLILEVLSNKHLKLVIYIW